jgi:hypothetical protein
MIVRNPGEKAGYERHNELEIYDQGGEFTIATRKRRRCRFAFRC